MGLTRTQMKTRWIAEGISGCLDFRRQTPAGATDTFLVAIPFLRQHCVDGPAQSCCRSGHTRCLPRQPALQRPVARHPACSSACGEYESPESRQSVRADRARECLLDNDRALPRQEAIILGSHSDGSHSAREQMLNPLPLIITESVASGGHGTSLPLGKEKGFFLQEERCPPNDQVFI